MNAHEPPTNGHETLPVPADSREVSFVDPVYDAELVEEPHYYSPRLGWFASWWLRSPRVPAWLKNRRQAFQAGKDVLVAALRAPDRSLGAVVRGLVVGARWWRRWVTVRDYREAAESSEKLADKFVEIRALALFRWKVTGAVAVVVALGGAVVDLVYGRRGLWLLIGVVAVALAVHLGRNTHPCRLLLHVGKGVGVVTDSDDLPG